MMSDQRAYTRSFLGVNEEPYSLDGELRFSKNVNGDAFPYLKSSGAHSEYRFDVTVPSRAGEAYEADVSDVPALCEDNLGKIYHYTPKEGMLIPGSYYVLTGGKWVKSFDRSNLPKYIGQDKYLGEVSEIPGTGEYSNYYYRYVGAEEQTIVSEDTDYFGTLFSQSSVIKSGDFISWRTLSAGKGWITGSYQSGYSTYDDTTGFPDAQNFGSGAVIKWNGSTSVAANGYYVCKEYRFNMYVSNTSIKLFYVSDAPLAEDYTEGSIVKYIGGGLPSNGKYYKCLTEIDEDGVQRFYFEEVSSSTGAESVLALPEPSADIYGSIFKYNGASLNTEGYIKCLLEDGVYYWGSESRPYINKHLTVNEYIDGYTEYDVKEIYDIHEHLGKMAVVFDSGSGMKLFYDNEIYSISSMSPSESVVNMVSCGEKLFMGSSGAVFDAEKKEFTFVGGEFNFAVPHDNFYNPGSGKSYNSAIIGQNIIVYSQDKSTLNAICSAMVQGLEIEYKTRINSSPRSATVESAAYTESSFGYKVGDSWITVEYAKLVIQTAETLVTEDLEYKDLYIQTRGMHDVVPWKNRLWGYQKDNIRATALEIFNADGGVVWNKSENTEMDSIRRKQWQGGNINAIAATTSSIVCFHRSYISILEGNTKSTMYTRQIAAVGIEAANRKSVSVFGDYVYFLSDNGVYVMCGGFPQLISDKVNLKGTEAVGACDGKKYYISLKRGKDYELWEYDISKRTWYRQDYTKILSFASVEGRMYMTDGNTIFASGEKSGGVEYEVVFQFDENTYRKKKYKKIALHGFIEDAAVYVMCDEHEREWRPVGKLRSDGVITLPYAEICETLHIKISGAGRFELRGIERIFEVLE